MRSQNNGYLWDRGRRLTKKGHSGKGDHLYLDLSGGLCILLYGCYTSIKIQKEFYKQVLNL